VRSIPSPDSDAFRAYRSRVLQPDLVDELAATLAMPVPVVSARVSMAMAEAAQTLRVVDGATIPDDGRVLEVGAGLGLTSAFLSLSGFDVTALEPSGSGFEEHEQFAPVLRKMLGSDHHTLDVGAEFLTPAANGSFALIFSNNVIEHVDDVGAVIAALAGVLDPSGVMIHSCPNYSVPFEPHFGIPLVPIRPALTARLLPGSVRDSGLWKSLNFVRARDLDRIASENNLGITFRRGLLAVSLDRLANDAEFRSRHALLGRIGRILSAVGVTAAVRRLPPRFATPMDVTLVRRPSSPSSARLVS